MSSQNKTISSVLAVIALIFVVLGVLLGLQSGGGGGSLGLYIVAAVVGLLSLAVYFGAFGSQEEEEDIALTQGQDEDGKEI